MKRHEHKKIAVCAHQNHGRMHHILYTALANHADGARARDSPKIVSVPIRGETRSAPKRCII